MTDCVVVLPGMQSGKLGGFSFLGSLELGHLVGGVEPMNTPNIYTPIAPTVNEDARVC